MRKADLRVRFLFEAERGHGIDPGGAVSGYPNGNERDCCQQQWCHDKRQRIPGFYPEEKASQEPRQPESSADTKNYTNDREDHSLTDDHIADVRSLSAESHADAEFLRPLLHGVGHEA